MHSGYSRWESSGMRSVDLTLSSLVYHKASALHWAQEGALRTGHAM